MRHEAEPFTEAKKQEPFVIRAHHLNHYGDLINYSGGWHSPTKNPLSPKEVTDKIIKNVKVEPIEGYHQDVLGTSAESADSFAQNIQTVFEKFVKLPDNYPAVITEEMPDPICNACAVGDHCKISPPKENTQGLNIFEKAYVYFNENVILPRGNDQISLNWFIRTSKRLRLQKPSIEKEKVIYSDTKKTQVVRKAKTTIGVIKQVLAELSSLPKKEATNYY